MNFLLGKKILITGIMNKWSIAYGIAKSMYKQGAELAFTCLNKNEKRKIKNIVKKFNSRIVLPCNFLNDKNIKKLFFNLSKYWNKFDGFLHSIAYAPKIQFSKYYTLVINRKDFNLAHDITSYSLISMLKECINNLNNKSSILTLTYIGSVQTIPYYNIMGLAKASLEANVRYIANEIGYKGIRINAISSGPIKTLSTYNIKNFNKIIFYSGNFSPLRRLVTIHEIGNTAAFLFSNLSSGITGQIIYVDGGFSISKINHLL